MMMMMMMKTSVILTLLLPSAASFIFGTPAAVVHPELSKFANAQDKTTLDICLNVGGSSSTTDNNQEARLNIHGLKLELLSDDASTNDDDVKMPGRNGPHSNLSSGVRQVQIVQDGTYVNMKGSQRVEFQNGCWELIWQDDSPAGKLIVGFLLENEVRRNSAKLEAGRIYLSFPVWTAETLAECQVEKFRIERKHSEYNQERQIHLEKYSSEPNLLKKALHYRNAAAAVEKSMFLNTNYAASIPLNEDVMTIPGDLLLCTSGTVWSKKGGFNNNNSHQLLGAAVVQNNNKNNKVLLKP